MMSNRDNIKEELFEVSPAIASLSRENVYSVPLNYFDGLAGNIMRTINADIAGLIPASAPAPFSVPDSYFNNLSDQILGKIRQQSKEQNEFEKELADVAPFLNTISKQMVYKVPDGYFEHLKVNASVAVKAPTKVRSISGVNKVFRYAVAAAVTGILAVGTYLFTANNNNVDTPAITSSINIPAAVNNLSDSEIVDYLNSSSIGLDVSATSTSTDAEINIDDYIKNMSDDEIRKYLNDNEEPQKKKAKDS
jgi:hypothetical protein